MDGNINFAARPGTRPGVRIVALLYLCLFTLASCSPDTKQAVVTGASAIPTSSVEFGTEIRGRVATLTRTQVAAYPALKTWGNELAKVCFRLSDTDLPTPATLRGYFALANYFLPEGSRQTVADYGERLLTIYTADYPVAVAAQGAGAPYLTLVGQGIQNGIKVP